MLNFLKRFLKVLFEFLMKKLNELIQRWAVGAMLVIGLVIVLVIIVAAIVVWMLMKGSS